MNLSDPIGANDKSTKDLWSIFVYNIQNECVERENILCTKDHSAESAEETQMCNFTWIQRILSYLSRPNSGPSAQKVETVAGSELVWPSIRFEQHSGYKVTT